MDKKLLVFNHNQKRFFEFIKRTDQKKVANQFLIKYFSKRRTPLNILDVGTGSGEHILTFLKFLKKEKVDFKLFYSDPSAHLHKIFRQNIKKFSFSKNISGESINNFEKLKFKKKFNVIIASQVFYYFKNWKKQINKIIGFLEKDGVAFIFMKSNKSANWKIRNFAAELTRGKAPKEHSVEELIGTLDDLKIKYRKIIIHSALEITPSVIGKKSLSNPAKALLSFIIRAEYNSISENSKNALNNFIKNNSFTKNKKRYLKLIDYCLIIKK